MFPSNSDLFASERHQDLLQRAARMRLIVSLRLQPSEPAPRFRGLAFWLGARLVTLGLKLQGRSFSLAPDLAPVTILETDYC